MLTSTGKWRPPPPDWLVSVRKKKKTMGPGNANNWIKSCQWNFLLSFPFLIGHRCWVRLWSIWWRLFLRYRYFDDLSTLFRSDDGDAPIGADGKIIPSIISLHPVASGAGTQIRSRWFSDGTSITRTTDCSLLIAVWLESFDDCGFLVVCGFTGFYCVVMGLS